VDDGGGRASLISGTFWLSLGSTVTAVTYLLATPGGKYAVAYGAVVVGLVAFARGLKRWSAASQPFPTAAVMVVALLPPVGAAALVGLGSWRQGSRRQERREAEEKRLSEARRVQEERRAAAERVAADEARAARHADRVARARKTLQTSSHAITLCDAALDLGSAGAREAIPDLTALLLRATEHASVRNCAAGALVRLGEIEQPLAFYLECARAGTSELLPMAIGGFGEIGPPAAAVALPYLEEALRSPYAASRYVAVETLAKLGPSAEELLRKASQDSDHGVRERAEKALGSPRR
jgi:hypothetical protein